MTGRCVGTPGVNDFLCYRTAITRGAPPFVPVAGVRLVDQFESRTVKVRKPMDLCAPADVSGAGTIEPAALMESFIIRPVAGSAHFVPRRRVPVSNVLGTFSVDMLRPTWLLMPTVERAQASIPPSDNYECYRARLSRGARKFPKRLRLTVGSGFTSPAKVFKVRRPRHLCTPTDINGQGLSDAGAPLLLCYRVRNVRGQPKHHKVRGLAVRNGFGAETLNTVREHELCLPSTRSTSGLRQQDPAGLGG